MRCLNCCLMSVILLWSVFPANGEAEVDGICLTGEQFSVDPVEPITNDCTVIVEGFASDVMYASLRVFMYGTNGTFVGVGIREANSVLITDQTPLTEEGQLVVLDITGAVQHAINNELTSFVLTLGPSLLGSSGVLQLGQQENCWGRLDFFNQPFSGMQAKAAASRRSEFHELKSVAVAVDGMQVFPNPANPKTAFSFTLDKDASVNLKIFDLRGRLIEEISGDAHKDVPLVLNWNGTDRKGTQVSSGVYLYQLAGDAIQQIAGKFSVVR